MASQDVDRLIDEIGLPQAAAQRRVAGILFTYRCSINCRHCLFACAGDRPNVVMTPRQCADALSLLHETGRVVHIAGGEAMLYWDTLSEAIRLAHAEGNAPHFIETNGSFATGDAIVRERLTFMAAHGVKGLYVSADPFHQEFVPPDRVLRVRRLTAEIFGERNFYGPAHSDAEIEGFPSIVRDSARLREYVRRRPPVMVGTAHRELARYLDSYAPHDDVLPARGWGNPGSKDSCSAQFQAETMWELHVDPYGNIQTNCGIILGRTPGVRPARLLAEGPGKANRFVRLLSEKGILGLADLAQRKYGFALPERVTQTCELCYLTRRFLHGFHPEVFGPAEVYAREETLSARALRKDGG